jgi:lantibiotic modifying enzyme
MSDAADEVRAIARWVLQQPIDSPRLYDGAAGIVVFLLEAAERLADEELWTAALKRSIALADALDSCEDAGLYTGAAGVTFALIEAERRLGCERLADGAARGTARVRESVADGDVFDLFGGTAGIGLFLLWAGEVDAAVVAGRRLLDAARPACGGSAWPKAVGAPRLLPNFSHGTAGVAFFLASLARATGDAAFLDGARAGGRHLLAIADGRGLVPHHLPGGEDLFYLGWCHGPAGTSRLFHRLEQVTGDAAWGQCADRSGRALLQSDVPARQTAGFWNNDGQCCGRAGVGEYALARFAATGDDTFRRLADDITADIRAAGVSDADGLRWVDAEDRVRPDVVSAKAGYMQGAAGIGAWLLHHEGRTDPIVFPDGQP